MWNSKFPPSFLIPAVQMIFKNLTDGNNYSVEIYVRWWPHNIWGILKVNKFNPIFVWKKLKKMNKTLFFQQKNQKALQNLVNMY